jgi:hypothetical protein
MKPWALLLVTGFLLMQSSALASNEPLAATVTAETEQAANSAHTPGSIEVGATVGTPALLNLNLGYWNDSGFPWIARASGMYYGDLRGLQLEFGWSLSRSKAFGQFLSLAVVLEHHKMHLFPLANDSLVVNTNGFGAMYGLNWRGLSAQAGLIITDYQHLFTGGIPDEAPIEITLQVGYTALMTW